MRTEQELDPKTSHMGLIASQVRKGLGVSFLLLALASLVTLAGACGYYPTAISVPTAAPAPEPAAVPDPQDEADALTRAYVEKAIERYVREGLEATVAFYNSEESVEGERYLTLLRQEDGTSLAMPYFQYALGTRLKAFDIYLEAATAEGIWLDHRGMLSSRSADGENILRVEPLRSFVILRDGLVFVSRHSVLHENVAEATQDYVSRAIALYQSDGLDATVAFYNSQQSLEGHFYLFLIGADDNYLAHPIFPHLIGTDVKDVVGSDGQELGKEIAQATEDGIWVEYLWPNPVTRVEEPKTTWAVRHDGLIFASGYYTSVEEAVSPAWEGADPREYTVDYVNRAIERYERDGLEAMKTYYNSVASFEGEWYLFAVDENDVYIVHSLLPRLLGTDIKDLVGSDGFELGKELAKATEEGIWVEYLWPHPITLQEVPKVGYAVRRDGLIFASGYYPAPEDPAADVKAFARQAMDYYDSNGLEATVAHFNSEASEESSYNLLLVSGEGEVLAFKLRPALIGLNVAFLRGPLKGEPVGELIMEATAEGHWISFLWQSTMASDGVPAHVWSVRHDGLVFSVFYFGNLAAAEVDDDA